MVRARGVRVGKGKGYNRVRVADAMPSQRLHTPRSGDQNERYAIWKVHGRSHFVSSIGASYLLVMRCCYCLVVRGEYSTSSLRRVFVVNRDSLTVEPAITDISHWQHSSSFCHMFSPRSELAGLSWPSTYTAHVKSMADPDI